MPLHANVTKGSNPAGQGYPRTRLTVPTFVPPPPAPPTFVAQTASAISGLNAGSVNGTIPASAAVGDLAIAVVASIDASGGGWNPIDTPAGWSQAPNPTYLQFTFGTSSVFYKILIAGEPGSVIAFTGTPQDIAARTRVNIVTYHGVNALSPFGGIMVNGFNVGANIVSPAYATAGGLAVEVCCAAFGNIAPISTPAGFTSRSAAFGNNIAISIADSLTALVGGNTWSQVAANAYSVYGLGPTA